MLKPMKFTYAIRHDSASEGYDDYDSLGEFQSCR